MKTNNFGTNRNFLYSKELLPQALGFTAGYHRVSTNGDSLDIVYGNTGMTGNLDFLTTTGVRHDVIDKVFEARGSYAP